MIYHLLQQTVLSFHKSNELHHLNLAVLIAEIALGYVIVLAVYTALTYIVRAIQYERAKKRVQGYDQELAKLEKHYCNEKYKK